MTNWEERGHPQSQRPGRERRSTPLVVFTCLLILGVTVASFSLLNADETLDEDNKVVLEPADHAQESDFFADLDPAAAESAEQSLPEIAEEVAKLPPLPGDDATTAVSLSGQQVTGTEPGLYAGIRHQAACNVARLRELLTAREGGEDSAKIAAWAEASGLDSVDGIEAYLGELTPVRLRTDIRVTNDGYADEQVTSVQSVQQAGTAVLVDQTGLPRVECNSGNPLSEPAPLDDELEEEDALDLTSVAADPDAAWARLNPEQVVSVTPGSQPVETFSIVDIYTEDLVERPMGSNGDRDLGPGDFQARLQWESPADLDLSVVDPNGAQISSESPEPENSHGRLEQDANRLCEDNMIGVEQIAWPQSDAPSGRYTVTVNGHAVGDAYQADCGGNEAEFTLTVEVYGQDPIVQTGAVGNGQTADFPVEVAEQ